MKKICVVTGSRAEYGLLKPIIKKLTIDDRFKLELVVTGMHLCPEFGLTYKEIETDNIKINKKVDIILNSDESNAITKSIGVALISFSEYFKNNKPDVLIILGDRYEIFAVAISAMIEHIPIAHISGGDTTEGTIDEYFRHSITKMSYLHFTGTEDSRRRVIQLGESPERVFNVGELGVENILNAKLMTLKEIENAINFKLDKDFSLVTFHPATTIEDSSKIKSQVLELLKAIDKFKDMKFIFTKSNSDTNGRIINKMINDYVEKNDNCILFSSLGQIGYLSTMKYAKVIIGNSSSGICEAPSFGIPTVNIGNRQKGRIMAESVITCKVNKDDIINSIKIAMSRKFNNIKNPYEGVNTSDNIINIINDFLINKSINLEKSFYNIGEFYV